MFKCEVCGNEFGATKENHYIARDKMVMAETSGGGVKWRT